MRVIKRSLLIAVAVLVLALLVFRAHPAPRIPQVTQSQVANDFTSYLMRYKVKGETLGPVQQTISVARVGQYYWAAGIKPWDGGPPVPEYGIYSLEGKMVDSGNLSPGQPDHTNPIKLAYQAYWDLALQSTDLPTYFSGLSNLYGGATSDLVSQAKQGNTAYQPAQYVQLLKPELADSPGSPVQVGFRCLLIQGMGAVIDERVVVQEKYSGGTWTVEGVRIDRDKLDNVNLGGEPDWVTVLTAGTIE